MALADWGKLIIHRSTGRLMKTFQGGAMTYYKRDGEHRCADCANDHREDYVGAYWWEGETRPRCFDCGK